MLDYFAQNGIGGEAIIWLIIAFFWVVAQLFSRKKERDRLRNMPDDDDRPAQPAGSPPAQQDSRSFEQEMRKFFETIGAEPMPAEELPPEQEPRRAYRESATPPPPPPARAGRDPRAPHAPRAATPPPPPPKPARTPAMRKAARAAAESTNLGAIDTALDVSALDTDNAYSIREIRDENFNAFVNPRTLLVNLNYLRMNMPVIPVSGLSTTGEQRNRPVLHGRQALRNAITTQLILSNPLAMGEDKGSYTKRVV